MLRPQQDYPAATVDQFCSAVLITEWCSKALLHYQRLTKKVETLMASVYLAGTNTRRVKRAFYGLFQGPVGKDVVSRAWRKVEVGSEALDPPIDPITVDFVA